MTSHLTNRMPELTERSRDDYDESAKYLQPYGCGEEEGPTSSD